MQINNCFSQIIGHQHSKWPNNKILIFFLRCLALLYFVFSLTSFPSLILLVIVFFDEKSRQLGHYTSDTTLLYGYPSFSSSLNNKLFHLHSQVRRRQLYSLVPDYFIRFFFSPLIRSSLLPISSTRPLFIILLFFSYHFKCISLTLLYWIFFTLLSMYLSFLMNSINSVYCCCCYRSSQNNTTKHS